MSRVSKADYGLWDRQKCLLENVLAFPHNTSDRMGAYCSGVQYKEKNHTDFASGREVGPYSSRRNLDLSGRCISENDQSL